MLNTLAGLLLWNPVFVLVPMLVGLVLRSPRFERFGMVIYLPLFALGIVWGTYSVLGALIDANLVNNTVYETPLNLEEPNFIIGALSALGLWAIGMSMSFFFFPLADEERVAANP